MHREQADSRFGGDFGEARGVEGLVIPAHAHLEGDGHIDGADGGFEQFGGQHLVAHQGAAGHLPDGNLFHRAAEIDIDDIGTAIDRDARGLGHGDGVAPRELEGAWLAVKLGHPERCLVLADHRPGGDHLGNHEPGAEFAREAAERQIGDAGHRRQDHRHVDRDAGAEVDRRKAGVCGVQRIAHHLGKLMRHARRCNAALGAGGPAPDDVWRDRQKIRSGDRAKARPGRLRPSEGIPV